MPFTAMRKDTHLGFEDMLADGALEEDLMEVPLSPRAFRAFLAVVLVLAAVALAQMGHLGLGQYDFYAARARANMSDERVVLAPRGIIYDRYGTPLVENVPSLNAFLIPRHLPAVPEERTRALEEIAARLHIDPAELTARLAARDWSVSDRVLLAEGISREVAVELASEPMPGLTVEPAFRRVHQVPLAFAHLIGYTGLAGEEDLRRRSGLGVEDQVGRAGLEGYYDEVLRGVNGREVTFRDAQGRAEEGRRVAAPEPGKDLHTSIDGEFQRFLYERLATALRDLGRTVGVAIAMDPGSGEILALVGIPSFDSNRIPEALDAPGKPLFNRAISGLYNPGSAIKPVVATAALTERVIDPKTEIFSKGYIEIPNPYFPESPSRFVDWRPNGWVNVASALAKSSNIYFYEVGGGFESQVGLGIERLKQWWERFGLGEPSGVDLVGEARGFLPDPAWKEGTTGDPWRIGDTYNVAIGQGNLLVTPLSLLNAVSAIANGGVLYRPRVVTAVGSAPIPSAPPVLADLRGEAGSAIPHVQEGMREAVRASYGTAHFLASLPFPAAAKTGTAQIEENTKLNAFFVGYAPASDPKLALLILVEDAVQGSLNTVPVARDVFLWYYNHRLAPSS